ncbi:hypothetical protein VP01_1020g2 [Puccinia sorghi]|uniref:Uncharacterized protein n=1 Tax=Puccinia sorghi TaxID=27349 RepID=A0A0L6VUS3_9BASI|nr:hypothetical protein VP01_1020g2 [Puccinia sorghi]
MLFQNPHPSSPLSTCGLWAVDIPASPPPHGRYLAQGLGMTAAPAARFAGLPLISNKLDPQTIHKPLTGHISSRTMEPYPQSHFCVPLIPAVIHSTSWHPYPTIPKPNGVQRLHLWTLPLGTESLPQGATEAMVIPPISGWVASLSKLRQHCRNAILREEEEDQLVADKRSRFGCPTCGVWETAQHFLMFCSRYQSQTQTLERRSSILKFGVNPDSYQSIMEKPKERITCLSFSGAFIHLIMYISFFLHQAKNEGNIKVMCAHSFWVWCLFSTLPLFSFCSPGFSFLISLFWIDQCVLCKGKRLDAAYSNTLKTAPSMRVGALVAMWKEKPSQ